MSDIQILGTVIASVLSYDHFIEITGDEPVTSGNSKWVPADGRSIVGSKLARISKESNAPDLRGVFLRGLNLMYNNGEPTFNIIHSDEEDDTRSRRPGNYQEDAIRQHNHEFSHLLQCSPGPYNGPGGFSHKASGSEGYDNFGTTGVNANAGKETHPKNVSVYYYIKIN